MASINRRAFFAGMLACFGAARWLSPRPVRALEYGIQWYGSAGQQLDVCWGYSADDFDAATAHQLDIDGQTYTVHAIGGHTYLVGLDVQGWRVARWANRSDTARWLGTT